MQETLKKSKKNKQKLTKDRLRKIMLGSNEKDGLIKKVVLYSLLIVIGFIYIYPLLHMISNSFMTLEDLLDSSIHWLPAVPTVDNYRQAFNSMNYVNSLFQSILIAGLPTLCNLISCSLIGYGLARYKFKAQNVIFALIIFSFILPSQATMIPTYVLYSNLGILGTLLSFILPALLGMGYNSAIFILIFYQFFKQIPQSLIEAALVDGSGHARTYFRIAIPLSKPAIVTVLLFSFVWYWNNSYMTELYVAGVMKSSGWTSLVIQLKNFAANFNSYATTSGAGVASLNESINMAGTILTILPILLVYLFFQKYFVESIDNAGITGQ